MTEYKAKFKHGIHDLKSEYAFRGNSQGDESVSNSIEEYKASQGWMSFVFGCKLDQEEIYKEVEKRKQWNKEYIEQLHAGGRFGKEYFITLQLIDTPLFDNPNQPPISLNSHRITFLDTSKLKKK